MCNFRPGPKRAYSLLKGRSGHFFLLLMAGTIASTLHGDLMGQVFHYQMTGRETEAV